MRLLVDAHGPDYWGSNLYNLWLSSLRALSPTASSEDPASAGMPLITGTEPWGRRLLNTQLASWAELRHDTILYAKQSYTYEPSCEFPDAYVDPYPEFYGALARFADYGTSKIVPLAGEYATYFSDLRSTMAMLQGMAEYERAGTPFNAEQMAFINEAVTAKSGCGKAYDATGWYSKLVFDKAFDFDPTIADVHTQPSDEGGNRVGKVLHVGTGMARLLVVTTNGCSGPRAYAGLASSYFETTTDNFRRLTDEEWQQQFFPNAQPPTEVSWMADVIVR
jgi:hypothetical protein